jgi:hypothetical protein
MPINKGGRGKKADYETKVIRIPLPIVNEVEKLIENYHHGLSVNDSSEFKTLEESIMIASTILKSKKSAKESIKKLLQVLYDCQNINL